MNTCGIIDDEDDYNDNTGVLGILPSVTPEVSIGNLGHFFPGRQHKADDDGNVDDDDIDGDDTQKHSHEGRVRAGASVCYLFFSSTTACTDRLL